ncbi:hypothetical protein C8R45DRAFT_940757 [Mycena sanguinolenta]|nr:hypothetical protein C8R45DRAFT_940757 [Mycena sanguinolenta]
MATDSLVDWRWSCGHMVPMSGWVGLFAASPPGSAFDASSLTCVLPTDNIPSHLRSIRLEYKMKKQIHRLWMELKNGDMPARYANLGWPRSAVGVVVDATSCQTHNPQFHPVLNFYAEIAGRICRDQFYAIL